MADIRVNGETLRSGAKDTDAVAAGVAQARDASGTLVKTAADAMMVSAEKGLRDSATGLRGAATALEGTDSNSAAGARRLGA